MTQSPKIQKPKRKEKLSDQEQSERFREFALSVVATGGIDDFEAIFEKIVKKRPELKKA